MKHNSPLLEMQDEEIRIGIHQLINDSSMQTINTDKSKIFTQQHENISGVHIENGTFENVLNQNLTNNSLVLLKSGNESLATTKSNTSGESATIPLAVAQTQCKGCFGSIIENKKSKKNIETKAFMLKLDLAKKVDNHQIDCENERKITDYQVDSKLWKKLPEAVAEDVKSFLNPNETPEQCEELVEKLAGDKTLRVEGIADCMTKFQNLNLEGINFSTDSLFIHNIKRLEEISRMTDGLDGLLDKFSDDLDDLDEDDRLQLKAVKKQMKITKPLTEYYYLRMSIISDPFYKTQLRSDISQEYHRNDSEQEKTLAINMLKLDYLVQKNGFLGEWESSERIKNRVFSESVSEKLNKNLVKRKLKNHVGFTNNLNNYNFDNSPNAEMFRPYEEAGIRVRSMNDNDEIIGYLSIEKQIKENKKNLDNQMSAYTTDIQKNSESYIKLTEKKSTIENLEVKNKKEMKEWISKQEELNKTYEYKTYNRLVNKNYVVTGYNNYILEPLFLSLSYLQRMEAAKSMDTNQMKLMLDNLAASEDQDDFEQKSQNEKEAIISECSEKNRQGLLQYKELLSRQAEYLFNKYHTLLENVNPEEINEHRIDFMSDFQGMPGIMQAINYMKNFPDVFDKKSKSDRRIEDLMSYYKTITEIGGYNRQQYANGTIENEATYFKKMFEFDADELRTARKLKSGMSKTIDWNKENKDHYPSEQEIRENEELKHKEDRELRLEELRTNHAKKINDHKADFEKPKVIIPKEVSEKDWNRLEGTLPGNIEKILYSYKTDKERGKFVEDFVFSKTQRLEAVTDCMNKFLNLDFKGLDLSTDNNFVNNLNLLGKISHMTDGLSGLLDILPNEELENFDQKKLEAVEKRMKLTKQLSEYYYLRMDIIADPSYKTYDEYKIRQNGDHQAITKKMIELYVLLEKNDALKNCKDISIKNTMSVNIKQRLQKTNYYVVGDNKESEIPLFKSMDALKRMPAFQNMKNKDIAEMIDNLVINIPEDATELERDKAAIKNQEGLREYKKVIENQLDYYYNKYGKGLETISGYELIPHKKEMDNDFYNMGEITKTLEYMKNFPGVFDETSKDDQRIQNLASYYERMIIKINSLNDDDDDDDTTKESEFDVTRGMRENIDWTTQYKVDYR